MAKPELKREAVRLRVEERRSLREIAGLLSISKGTASLWLRDIPLSNAEMEARRKRQGSDRKPRPESSQFAPLVEALDRHQKAKLAETAVIFRLILHQFSVFEPVSPWSGADLLVGVPGTTKRISVQVKSVKNGQHGLPTVRLQRNVGNSGNGKMQKYPDGELDAIVGYDARCDRAYVYLWDEVRHLKSSVAVTDDALENWDKLRL
jgi:transposase-like protein